MIRQLITKDLACGHGGRALFSGLAMALRSRETARILGKTASARVRFCERWPA
jgi:ABC-type transport system involved in cytochrome c biogenesis ATPase subunit